MPKTVDILGKRFGGLTVLSKAANPYNSGALWVVRCDCGNERTMLGITIRRAVSCGCVKRSVLGKASVTHGARKSRAYSCWWNMKSRCERPSSRYFHDYGGRGIKVCERWQEFANFLDDMGQPPDGFTIERVDNDKGYEPGNVRWASRKDQANNRRSSRLLEHGNKSMTLQQWADKTGIKRATIAYRLDHGWPPEKALRP